MRSRSFIVDNMEVDKFQSEFCCMAVFHQKMSWCEAITICSNNIAVCWLKHVCLVCPRSAMTKDLLSMQGCSHEDIGPMINGVYEEQDQCFGKASFHKVRPKMTVEVHIYFWNPSEDSEYAGWWIGPDIGGSQVWAYNPGVSAERPPSKGWKVGGPYLPGGGVLDDTLRLSELPTPPPPAPAPATYRHRGYRHVTAEGVGRTRTKNVQVLDDNDPLLIKRKKDAAANRAAKAARQ